jgi:PAS domain S-box-containing protein
MLDQQEKYHIPLHLILIFALLVIGIITSGYVLYATQKAELKKRDNNDLSAIAELKVREIVSWRKESIEDAHVIQQNVPTIHRIRQFLENPSSDEIRQELLLWIKSLRESYKCRSVVLLDTNKRVRLYWGDETRLVGSHTAALAEKAMRTKQIIFSDFYREQVKQFVHIDIFVPLIIPQGHENIPVGILLLRIDPQQTLYSIIQLWPTSSPTAETILVRREGDEVVFLNELRHKKDTALTFRMPISEKQLPAAMAARGEEGIVEGMDYRSIPVLAAIKAVPDTPWYVIAKIDTDEVYAPVNERFWMMFIIVCTLIISAGTATALVWRHQRARFYRKQYEAKLEHEALTKHYEFLTKYANDIILMVDEGWKIVEANERAIQAYGCTRDELLQMNIREVYDPEVIPSLPGWIDQVDKGNGLVYETAHRRKDGTIFPVEISARAITVEGEKFYQAIIRDITARKRSEGALRNSEGRLRTLVQTIPDLIWLKDKDGAYLSCNTMFERFFGAREADIAGKTDYDFVDRELADSFLEHDRKAMAAGSPTSNDEWITFADDGHRAFLETIKTPMHDARGTLIGLLGIGRDITERKQAEEALKESENKYRRLANNVNDVIFLLDMNLNYTYISPSVKILRGYEPAEVLKQPSNETLTPSSWDLAVKTLSEIMDLEKSGRRDVPISRMLQLEMMRKDGTTVWTEVRFSFIRDEDQQLVGILGVTRDITERKREVEELRSYAAEISDLYNNAPCGYHSLGPDGTFLRMNDTELQWFGYTRDEIIGKKTFSDITTPESRQLFQEIYPAFKERGWAGNLEFDVIRKDGTILPVILNATAVKDADGNYIMSRSTIFDNSEHQRTQAELRRDRERLEVMVGIRTNELESKNAELEELRAAAVSASQAKSDFLASMSHELRTPLNAIIGFSDVLLDAYFGTLNEKQKEYMMDILESGKHLLNLINDILDISKVEAGKMELELAPVEIGNLLASCTVMIKEKTHKHGIDLKVDIPNELLALEMFADQRKIKQIVFNLLSNAAKFTPNGGTITLSALRMRQEGNDVLEVSVMDTGIGIPPEHQEKIFENFYQIRGGLTGKTPGTGLGLSVSKQLVELHGGKMRLKSEGKEKGSQFSFTLPVNVNRRGNSSLSAES